MAENSNSIILSVDELHVSIGARKIINGISFQINQGERVGIIGPNGSGKTTLFNCISGFLPVEAGSITLQEQEISRLAPNNRARLGLGRVFQNPGIFREMSVYENMLMAVESNLQINKKEYKAKVEEYLTQVGLLNQKSDKAGSLSGGQMRLLEISRTLALGAEFLLLDEPTAGVAPVLKQDVRNLLQLASEHGKTILVIEHDIGFIGSLCDRIIVLNVGQVIFDGTPEEVRSSNKVHEIYFGSNNA